VIPNRRPWNFMYPKVNARRRCAGAQAAAGRLRFGGDAEKARTFAKRLIEQDKVDVIVGGSTTGETNGRSAPGGSGADSVRIPRRRRWSFVER